MNSKNVSHPSHSEYRRLSKTVAIELDALEAKDPALVRLLREFHSGLRAEAQYHRDRLNALRKQVDGGDAHE